VAIRITDPAAHPDHDSDTGKTCLGGGMLLVTSPAGAVAKYCDEYVCLCVCLSVCPRGYPRNHTRDRYQFLYVLPMSVTRSSSGMLMIGRIAYRRKRVTGVYSAGKV